MIDTALKPHYCKTDVSGSFFRYEAVEYASLGIDGEYEAPKLP